MAQRKLDIFFFKSLHRRGAHVDEGPNAQCVLICWDNGTLIVSPMMFSPRSHRQQRLAWLTCGDNSLPGGVEEDSYFSWQEASDDENEQRKSRTPDGDDGESE